MKALKGLFIAFVVGLLLASCGSSSPEDIAVDFTKSLYKGDTKAVLGFFDFKDTEKGSGEKEFLSGKISAATAQAKEFANNKGGVKKIEVAQSEIEENTANIEVLVTFKDDSTKTEYIDLQKKVNGLFFFC